MPRDIEADCKFDAGFMVPIIDPMRCEAAGPCVPICPYDVLAIHTVPADEKAKLPIIGRIKLFVHGGKQAFVEHPDACHGCGLCVQACPEKAIKLQKRPQKAANGFEMQSPQNLLQSLSTVAARTA